MSAGPASPVAHGLWRWRPAPSATRVTLVALPVLLVVAWLYVLGGERGGAGDLVAARTWERSWAFLRSLLGARTELTPRGGDLVFLDPARWWEMARLAYATLAMSVLAIWLSVIGMLATVMLGARPDEDGTLRGPWRVVRYGLFAGVRATWVISRSIPELVWALMLIFVMPPGLLAGAVALGLHNFGIVGKLCSEVVEDLDRRPARALRAAGAGSAQRLLYGVLPQAAPQFLTFALYRWEVIIRTTIVVGFVSAAGLGREFRLAMSFFHYTDVALVLATYFVLVIAVDLMSGWMRGLAR